MSALYHIKSTSKKALKEIADRINSLNPAGKAYAAFDLDNTLLVGDIGESVFALLVKKKLIKKFGWKDYQSLILKNKLKAYKHIIDLMQGLKLSVIEEVTNEVINYTATFIRLEGYKIPIPKVNPLMKSVLGSLKKKGLHIYIVTASNEVSARIICEKFFGLHTNNIIGAEVAIDKNGIIKVGKKEFPYAEGKVSILKKRFMNKPLVTGGDSPGDKYLLNYTDTGGIKLWLGKHDFYSSEIL